MQREIKSKLRGMQTRFDGFNRWIIQKLVDLQSPDLKGIHKELVILWAAIEVIHTIPFPSMPFIEKIIEEQVSDI